MLGRRETLANSGAAVRICRSYWERRGREMNTPRPGEIHVIPVPFPDEIAPGVDLVEKLRVALRHQKLSLREDDIVVIKHKIVSKADGQVVPLAAVKASRAAKSWARQCGTDARVV